ncbi:hypothetical protein ACH4TX_12355 [Streptomyces sp. NPDC021098]|uniref:hypothetical protein n=1 Tax=unclassified Streptomyces TaxID=2593676 RepID=UPI0037BAAAC0
MSAPVTTRHIVASTVAGAVAAVLLSGCGLPGLDSGSEPEASPSKATFVPKAPVPSGKSLGPDAHVPDPPRPDGKDATEVAKAWAVVAYGYDTKYDTSPHDAVLRASPYFTKKKAAEEREYSPAAGSGEQWNNWAAHKAWTKATVTLQVDGDSPPDKKTVVWRQLAIVGTAYGRDGWKGKGARVQAFVKLVRSDGAEPWRISMVNAIPEAAVPSAVPSASPN